MAPNNILNASDSGALSASTNVSATNAPDSMIAMKSRVLMRPTKSLNIASPVSDVDSAEEWRGIDGWPGYEVSSMGQVRSITRVVTRSDGKRRTYLGRVLKSALGKRAGYRYVALSDITHGKEQRAIPVHRLVALAFLGPQPSGKHEVAHNDGVAANNRADNLRWATRKENSIDTLLHGRHPNRLKIAQISEIRSRLNETINAIVDEYQVSREAVLRIMQRRTWTGFI